MEEIWKDIPEFGGVYQASDQGNLRSVDRMVMHKNGQSIRHNGKVLVGKISNVGYRSGCLGYPEKHYIFHRLVAKTFIPNPENAPCVNHKNGIKTDNRVENLEWVTKKQNALHSTRVLKKNIWGNHNLAKLTEDDVIDMRILRTFGASYAEMGRSYGVSECTVSNAVRGKNWVHRVYATGT